MLTRNDLIDAGVDIGEKVEESVYILVDGTLWSGLFDCGKRGVEHREAEQFSELDRYDEEAFWEDVMVRMGLVMVIPEVNLVLFDPRHVITQEQQDRIHELIEKQFKVEIFR